jgi:hypothetical protein
MYLILRALVWLSTILLIHPAADLYASDASSKPIMAEDGRYRVSLTGPGEPSFDPKTGGRVKFTFSVIDKTNDHPYPVYLDNVTAQVDHIAIYQGKLIVMGEEATLHSSVTSLIDLDSREERDSFIGFGQTLSETGRFLSYRKFYPQQTAEPEAMSDLILIYDLDDSADGNRIRGGEAYKNDPSGRLIEVGHPVYPEVNAGKKHYRVWVREENERHTVIPNGFFWFDHDRKIAFGDQIGDETYLVVLDLSDGLNHPIPHKMGIDLMSLLKPEERKNEAVLQEAKRLKLENIQDLKNGKFRIRISSGIPLQNNQIELPKEVSGPAVSEKTHESVQPAHDPLR